ncbi:MAG: hypothetical protein AB1424_05360, partial [Thermodesulfobacteriota bacterium]
FKKMGHVTIIVNNYQHLLNISDIKMTLEINKTATQADLGNSPSSLRLPIWLHEAIMECVYCRQGKIILHPT